ncbi:hypothetical protein SAMN04489707_101124 [Paenacidovorax caeni]|uniref:Uncharacterized protein n=1 Tax=Paenacidovorax caeni TaxID=343013 RepID=A0A1I7HKJ1_9BURK|nr:hypothetical protein SAMN04489707_101124 [Paenacidovorax caeni]
MQAQPMRPAWTWRAVDSSSHCQKKAPQALNLQGFFRQKAGGLPQANTPAVSCMRADTSPKWCSVSPQVISSWVSVLK